MDNKYAVHVYQGGSKIVSFENETPFMAFHVGDTLNPTFWGIDMMPGLTYKILQIDHVLRVNDGIVQHAVFLYTEVEDVVDEVVGLEDF